MGAFSGFEQPKQKMINNERDRFSFFTREYLGFDFKMLIVIRLKFSKLSESNPTIS